MNRQSYWHSPPGRTKKSVAVGKYVASPSTSAIASHQNKSLEMKKKQLPRERKELKKPSSTAKLYTGDKSNIPLTKTAKMLKEKFKTATKPEQSPSIKNTYKDTDLDMRTRLDLWLKNKGKAPQTPTLSKHRFPKTPVGTTPNQRRKTWCYVEPNNKVRSVLTPRRSGILKKRNMTEKKTKRNCSFILQNKENSIDKIAGKTWSGNFNKGEIALTIKEEKYLNQALEKCYEMLKEDYCQLDEIAYSLDDIQREHPNVLRLALYWICRAKLAETVGDHEVVVCMIDQAFNFPAQPKELVQKYFTEYKSRKQTEGGESPQQESIFRSPYKTPSKELAKLDGEVFKSSVVRFCLIDSTPVRNRRKPASEKRILTPVRRTTRWERCGIIRPKTIEENRITIASLDELSSPVRSNIVFKPNSLLFCQLDEELQNLGDICEC